MSIKIDPSYLRYIHDGLNSGSIHAENASSLPEGLTGLYEASFLGELNVKESQQLLKRFAYFSLLKKEVSCHFVAVALEEPESEIIDFISNYSKWFNSAQAGKFSIYHERLRTYILSSISQNEFDEINNRIIALSQVALAYRSNDEWEYYALEYFSNHLLIASMISGNGDPLKKLAYDTGHWNHQIEISKGFEWTKKMLNEMMQWAAKYDDEEVIECALNKVNLHHMEQNDAPRIVELVANNDIETALQRIEAFGGNDKEGLQKKFILYMLCLMELTLLDSKDKLFRKEAIEKLLRHLDENIPVDHSVLNWGDFFPSQLIFQMSSECPELYDQYLSIYERTEFIEIDWINEISSISKIQLQIFEYLIENKIVFKDSVISDLCIKLINENKFDLAVNIVEKYPYDSDSTFSIISIEYLKINKIEKALYFLEKIDDFYLISYVFIEFAKIYKVIDFNKSREYLNYSVAIIDKIDDIETKIKGLKNIANYYFEIEKDFFKYEKIIYKDILKLYNKINQFTDRVDVLISIASDLWLKSYFKESDKILENLIDEIRTVNVKENKVDAVYLENEITKIVHEYAKQGKFTKALVVFKKNLNPNFQISSLILLANEIRRKGLLTYYDSIIQKAKNIWTQTKDVTSRNSILIIASSLTNYDKTEVILFLSEILQVNKKGFSSISYESTIDDISINLKEQNSKIFENEFISYSKNELITNISYGFIKNNEFDKSIKILNFIDEERDRIIKTVKAISISFYFNGAEYSEEKFDLLGNYIAQINEPLHKINRIIDLASGYLEIGKTEKGVSMLKDVLIFVQNSGLDFESKKWTLYEILNLFEQYCFYETSSEILRLLIIEVKSKFKGEKRDSVLKMILMNFNESNESFILSKEIINEINEDFYKIEAIIVLALKLFQKNKFESAMVVLNEINIDKFQIDSIEQHLGELIDIANYLMEVDKLDSSKIVIEKVFSLSILCDSDYYKGESRASLSILKIKLNLFDEAIELADTIDFNEFSGLDLDLKCKTLKRIAVELASQNKIELAIEIIKKIDSISFKTSAYKKIVKTIFINKGFDSSLKIIIEFVNKDMQNICVKKLVDLLSIYEVNLVTLKKIILSFPDDINSIRNIINKYFLFDIYYGESLLMNSKKNINTLELQWAIDVKNQLLN